MWMMAMRVDVLLWCVRAMFSGTYACVDHPHDMESLYLTIIS
jgi:hypothetical protein